MGNKKTKLVAEKIEELERKNRQNNPDCYNKDGTIKKGSKLKLSNNAKRTKRQLRTLYRKKKEFIKEMVLNNYSVQRNKKRYIEIYR